MSTKGELIVAGGMDGIVRVFKVRYSNNNVNSVVLEKELAVHSAQINAVGFSAKDDILFSASSDKTCKVFSTQDWKLLHSLSLGASTLGGNLEFRDAL